MILGTGAEVQVIGKHAGKMPIAEAQGATRRAGVAGIDAAAMLLAPDSGAPASILAISTRASPMSRRRILMSRSRQRSTRRRSRGGVDEGRALKRGGSLSTEASFDAVTLAGFPGSGACDPGVACLGFR
ncbi:MAG: hypothetical protein JJE39_14405 [Vicinamibacteria bacterium]|nr:hypothetical protein [Vicinamibacteria bacterium]